MEVAIGIVCTLIVAVIGWILFHNSQCRGMERRVTRLEEWRRHIDGRGREG